MKIRQARKVYRYLNFNVMDVLYNMGSFPSGNRISKRTWHRMETKMRRRFAKGLGR